VETAAFDYELPPEAIAQQPLARRDSARLLVDRGDERPPGHRHVRDLPDLLEPGDLVVVNTTRVLPARLHLRKRTGGAAEVMLLDRLDATHWEALVRPGRRLPPGTRLESPTGELAVEVGDDLGDGVRVVEVEVAPAAAADSGDDALFAALDRAGELPLPPYIDETLDDPERYQTIYADRPGSVAAPTAGLHLTTEVLDRFEARGIELATVELNVGLGTFRPIAAEKVEQHVMHGERYRVPTDTMERAERAQRVVAVGTTVVRALESASATGELEGRTELFIHGDHEFRVVDGLLTNFHLPRSSLLVLIDAFVGPRWRDLYATALERDYRFLSFGDAMLLTRRDRITS
jgi:S-adenosylmethionine:tRNA ribosyltransferase-isomerase